LIINRKIKDARSPKGVKEFQEVGLDLADGRVLDAVGDLVYMSVRCYNHACHRSGAMLDIQDFGIWEAALARIYSKLLALQIKEGLKPS
jgi:hypothetical protein